MGRNDDITDELRRDILGGAFLPGERLVELNLTERYDCGRAAVRAALVQLATEDLIDREANRGATVRRISVDEAIQITEARAALESLIARHAARNVVDDERDELRQIIEVMREAVDAGDSMAYSELNGVLHRRIREISCHLVAATLVENLRNRASHHQFRLSSRPGRSAESLEQHAAIVDAIVAGDEPGAAAAMEKHLLSVVDVLERWGSESQ